MTTRADMAAVAWTIKVPLLGNRYMLAALAQATLGGAALVFFLVAFLLAVQSQWAVIPRVALLLSIVAFALFLTGLLVMAWPMRNAMTTRFRVDEHGVGFELTDPRVRNSTRAAFLLGVVLGKPAAAGSAALAMSQESQSLSWQGRFHAEFDAAGRTIALRNGWRTLMRVYCLPENFAQVSGLIRSHLLAHGRTALDSPSPLKGVLLRSALLVIISLPVFAAREIYGISLLVPFLWLCFSLAMLWLVRGLAWVSLLLSLFFLGQALLGAVAERRSFSGLGNDLRYRSLSGDDWALTSLAGLALLTGAWMAVRILRGRIRPVLEADEADAGVQG